MQKQFENLERVVRNIRAELGFLIRDARDATDEDGHPILDTDDISDLERRLDLALVDLDMARNERGLQHP